MTEEGFNMSLKWEVKGFGGKLVADNFSISCINDEYYLYLGWNFIVRIKTADGCKRIANCIHDEIIKSDLLQELKKA